MGTSVVRMGEHTGDPLVRSWTREEYHRASELGIFGHAETDVVTLLVLQTQ